MVDEVTGMNDCSMYSPDGSSSAVMLVVAALALARMVELLIGQTGEELFSTTDVLWELC